jgi:hypothetical protein
MKCHDPAKENSPKMRSFSLPAGSAGLKAGIRAEIESCHPLQGRVEEIELNS